MIISTVRIDASSSASASSLSLRSLLIPKATLNTTTTPTPTLPKPQITGTLSLSFLSSNAIVCGQGKRDFEDRRSWTQLCLHCTSQELHARDCYSGTKHWKFCSVQLITLPTSICGPSDVFSSLSYFGAVKQLELDSIHSFQRTKDLMTEAMFSLNTMTEDGNIKEGWYLTQWKKRKCTLCKKIAQHDKRNCPSNLKRRKNESANPCKEELEDLCQDVESDD
ncbi:unnamed protein product [Prunus armeniaca]|uniref:Uncharacterized protein n=1 Tax=Prunus armeniaca TaxID=36596 RepID=A0A6J5X081_PRUAR|nr:unnamed protein product [Prunus armeniaca]